MKHLRFALAVLPLIALACATESSEGILQGEWGGKGLGLQATSTSVRVELPCNASGTHPGPAEIQPDGTFEFETMIQHFYGAYEAYIEGSVANARLLRVEVITEYGRPSSQPFTLVAGADPDFQDFFCLGANP
jgi:hypothetical protein